jgi:hypothetical protein
MNQVVVLVDAVTEEVMIIRRCYLGGGSCGSCSGIDIAMG